MAKPVVTVEVARVHCRGWWAIWGYVICHNVLAAGRRKPMLSDGARAYHTAHPILSTVLTAGLVWHLSGRATSLGVPWSDPVHWLGVAADQAAELARRCR